MASATFSSSPSSSSGLSTTTAPSFLIRSSEPTCMGIHSSSCSPLLTPPRPGSLLLGDPQIIDKRPFMIDPLPCASKTCFLRHPQQLGVGILVARLGPNGFPETKGNRHTHHADGGFLRSERAQMHFDALCLAVVNRLMLKPAQIKIRAELPVDPRQQIAVERRRHSQGIVVRSNERSNRFHEVRPEQQRITLPQNASHSLQKFNARVAIKVADRAPQKEHQQAFAFFSARRDFEQAIEVFALETHDADAVDVAQLSLARG